MSRESLATGSPNIQKEGKARRRKAGEVVMKDRNSDAKRSSASRTACGGGGGTKEVGGWEPIQVRGRGVSGPGPVFRDHRNTKGRSV